MSDVMTEVGTGKTPADSRITHAGGKAGAWHRRLAFVAIFVPNIGMVWGAILLFQGVVRVLDIALLVIMYAVTMFGVEAGFHRMVAHRAFQTTGRLRALIVILASMAVQGSAFYWAASHRRHHRYSDRPGDPHSPHMHPPDLSGWLRGLWHAHAGWLFVPENIDYGKYALDLLKDKTMFRLHRFYPAWILLGLFIPTGIAVLYDATWDSAGRGFLWGGLVRIALVQHAVWSVNSLCHIFGRRPFQTGDKSTNNVWLALTSFGGSWHNNHHAFQRTAYNAFSGWQFDPCYLVLRPLERLGMIWDVQCPTATEITSRLRTGRSGVHTGEEEWTLNS